MAESLFPQQRPGGQGAAQHTPLITFKAGKCNLSERQSNGKFSVSVDKRRGTLSLTKSQDQLIHFRWSDRSTGVVEYDRIVFPDEINFKKCKTGKDTDRVYILRFTQASQAPMMFWMQDKASDKDAENSSKVTEYANNPSLAVAATPVPPAGVPGVTAEQWAQLMGLPAPATESPAPSAPAPVPSAPAGGLDFASLFGPSTPAAQRPLTAEDLQGAMAGGTPGSIPAPAQRPLTLQEILSSEAVIATGILNDPAARAALIEQLPEGQRTEAFLEESIRSPQFRQSMSQFSGALESDNINNIMANFNIDPSPGMENLIRGDGVGAFVASLQADVEATATTDAQAIASSSIITPAGDGVQPTDTTDEVNDENKMDEE
mmetsp:Transcript_10419/g.10045  ORF Transcript_10419/g.10045 Transcript_10419/m.10045 type:complete len:375 (+) Transcript_10419:28-1152(+)|eukprot:CAMPEP_0119040064 /NCGR_PEP_ID=MMETSP1177-20130426/9889_1 /TAXON_ID=2985 /ORGANISM="Ochromonas sp, Strain CCMP1899" /LENGTH=374 /DNA_ID=CAMNT_0007004759 /DNA_START=22 /DNA_END=1146 /DNA_ORIENTATION=-